ncbi:MAG: 1,2-phenylacetyl-CoA epoxidase subunit PaaD [Actinomycetota bacterium]
MTAPLRARPGRELAVHAAVASVDDPEYPEVSIVDLGLLESIAINDDGDVAIGLIPTFSGCPALAVIAADVEAAVAGVDGVASVDVRWLNAPAWTVDRISHDARVQLADQFTVAVELGRRPPTCPRCGAPTVEQSMFGPSRCRSVHQCPSCRETVEVMRS